MTARHFLTLRDINPQELTQLLDRAIVLKQLQRQHQCPALFPNYILGMIFEKASTRTRVSFEAGMAQLGGHAMFLSSRDTQLGRGEPIEDSARVMSSMVDIIMIRTFGHDIVERFAASSRVPVINALTDDFHPCQLLADLQTYREHRGDIRGKTVTWIGDGNNMCQTWIQAAELCDFELRIACPEGFEPNAALVKAAGSRVTLLRDPADAIRGAHLVTTDVWASMGQESEAELRRQQFASYQVTTALMDTADDSAVFMHCLPAHRGEEVSAELMDDPRAIVWDEAENRLHSQKALIEFLLTHSHHD